MCVVACLSEPERIPVIEYGPDFWNLHVRSTYVPQGTQAPSQSLTLVLVLRPCSQLKPNFGTAWFTAKVPNLALRAHTEHATVYLAGSDSWSLSATGTADDAQHSTLAQLQVTSAAPSPDMPEVTLHRHVALEVAAYGPGQSMGFGKVDCGRDGVSAISEAQTPHTTRLTDVV